MHYKQKKHLRQHLNFKIATSKTNLFFIFQLKAVNVLKWILLKKILLKYKLKAKIFSIKSFQKSNFFTFKSKLITNLYNGKVLIIYSDQILVCSLTLKKIMSFFDNKPFLIPLHVFFYKSFFSFNRLKTLLNVSSKNTKVELMLLLLYLHQWVIFFNEVLHNSFYIFRKTI